MSDRIGAEARPEPDKPGALGRRPWRWIRRHPLIAFPAIYLGWAYLFWVPVLRSESSVWAPPSLWWFLAGGASPLIAGIALAVAQGGRARLADLFRRLVDWRRIPPAWWLVVLLYWLAFDLAMAGLAVLLGVTDAPLQPRWGLLREPGALLFLVLLSFVFPAVEEVGLRGSYLEALQERLPPPAAGVVNGIAWAAWHAPFVWFPGYYANTSFHPQLSWWLPMIVCHALLIAYAYDRTNRSLLAVLLFHGMMNFTGEWLRISPAMYPFMLLGNLLMALLAVWAWRRGPRNASPCGRAA